MVLMSYAAGDEKRQLWSPLSSDKKVLSMITHIHFIVLTLFYLLFLDAF